MSTPHDGAEQTGNGSHPNDDQPSSTIPAGEYIIGGPGCPMCFASQEEPAPTLEELTPDLQHLLKRLKQQQHILWGDAVTQG